MVPIIVKIMITPIVETIGPMELLLKQEKVSDNAATVSKAK